MFDRTRKTIKDWLIYVAAWSVFLLFMFTLFFLVDDSEDDNEFSRG